jgi:DNA-binding transcriptional ArsR family regulator
VSQHLKVLREAGLVVGTARGASTVYRADHSGLARVRDWVDRFWDDALDTFAEAAEREEQP